VPFPGAIFRQVVEQLVRENVLMSGRMRLGPRVVDLADARGDMLVAVAERDGVVPAAATEPALELVGDPRRRDVLRLPGGHVTFGAGKAARTHTMPRLTEWITAHSDDIKEAGWRSAASSPPTGLRSSASSTRSRMRIARS
jgi:polyhydroxyalkanoate synthase